MRRPATAGSSDKTKTFLTFCSWAFARAGRLTDENEAECVVQNTEKGVQTNVKKMGIFEMLSAGNKDQNRLDLVIITTKIRVHLPVSGEVDVEHDQTSFAA